MSKMADKVMIVENNAIISMNLESILLALDYNVVGICDSGEEAIEEIKTCEPDIVFIDYALGADMTGIDVALFINQYPNIEYVFTSGNREKIENHEKFSELSHLSILSKPYSDIDIEESVKNV